jgi:fatty acid desaturase
MITTRSFPDTLESPEQAAIRNPSGDKHPERVSVGDDELDVQTRGLVKDLYGPRPAIFWTDLLASALIGWGAFVLALRAAPLSLFMLTACLLSGVALYRGLCFTHEIAHLRRDAIPGFETVWNLLFGVPLLLPSFTYLGVHQSHHNLSTYGTKDDPEYLPFASSRRLIFAFSVRSSLLIPLTLLVRFLILAPIGLVWPRFHRWLEVHASSFSMNSAYRRNVSSAMAMKMRRWEAATIMVWGTAIGLMVQGVLPSRTLLIWYAVLAVVSFLNTARVLGAHEYESDGRPRNRLGQLNDSIDTPGGPWTEVWAPVGLRYHALHHYFPGIPYHHLGTAYRRLTAALPHESLYRKSTSPSLLRSLKALYLKARERAMSIVTAS